MVGNPLNYTKYDVIRAFLAVFRDQNLSRSTLSKDLDIGEGSMRTILDSLKLKGLIISDQMGHKLTKKGEGLAKGINSVMEMRNSLAIDFYNEHKFKNTALQLKCNGKKIGFNLLHRDLAIKNGAESCLMFAYKNRSLELPFLEIDNDFEAVAGSFGFEEGDVLIVTFANSQRWAEISALAVAENLMGKGILDI
jgi:Mn-dependent DtxR family transcriptional regulator